jgi:hypothetical protein
VLTAGEGATVTGTGSVDNPYVVSAASSEEVHDGAGSASTVTNLSANSPIAPGANTVAIGENSGAIADGSVVVGQAAVASGDESVVIGHQASSSAAADSSVAIGFQAFADESNAIAIGTQAFADQAKSIAIGEGTSVLGVNAVALGYNASAQHNNAVALGQSVATTATEQVNAGTKRVLIGAPNSALADADLINSQISFYLDQTANTLVVKVKYSSGTVKTGTVALT